MFDLLKKLTGRYVSVEHAAPGRAAPEVLENVLLWDLFPQDGEVPIALFIMVRKPIESPVQVGATAPLNVQTGAAPRSHQFYFKWLQVGNIVSVTQYAGLSISEAKRRLDREETPPLYNDGKDGWEVLDEGVKYWIEKRLFELKLRDVAPTPPAPPAPPAPKPANPPVATPAAPANIPPAQRVAP